jgi:hypothetical protein
MKLDLAKLEYAQPFCDATHGGLIAGLEFNEQRFEVTLPLTHDTSQSLPDVLRDPRNDDAVAAVRAIHAIPLCAAIALVAEELLREMPPEQLTQPHALALSRSIAELHRFIETGSVFAGEEP